MPEILSIGELLDLGNSASTAGLIPYSALEFNDSGDISAISGSAIAGGVDTTIVSAIASSYVASGISGKVDQSAFDNCCSSVQSALSGKADQSALDNCCSAMSSVVSAKAYTSALTSYVPYSALKNGPTTATISAIDSSAVYDYSAHARISTLSTSRIPFSALEYSAGSQTITAISGSAIAGQNFNPTQLQLIADSATMTASSVANGVKIGVKVPIMVVSNSSQATANGVVYVVTG